jgi:osmoprotectant transport system substrate-binding protein
MRWQRFACGTLPHVSPLRRHRSATRLVALFGLLVVLGACRPTGGSADPSPSAAPPVRVGTGPQPESQLLAAVMVALLTSDDVAAEPVVLADAADARRALELGDVDVLPSYTGEAWLEVLNRADPPTDQATSLARVSEFDEQRGLIWLRPPIVGGLSSPPADATFAFVVEEDGPHAEVLTMSQLAASLGQVEAPVLCVDPDFANREDGLPVVLDAYSIAPESVERRGTVPSEAVLGVAAGDCDAGLTSATDGAAWAIGLRPLLDDLGVFPAFVVAPVVDEDALARVEGALRPLTQQLTTQLLGSWNARVVQGEAVGAVAADAAAQLVAEPAEG